MPQPQSLLRLISLGQKTGTNISHKGGIDNLQPGQFSGWVVADGINLHEVRLLVGDHLIARGEINQQRADVNDKLGYQGAAGFTVELPAAMPMVNWQGGARVIALSADGSKQVELGLLGKKQMTGEILKALLQSDLLGFIGHCDGMVQGAIRGWACRRGQQRSAQIWLQASGVEPIAVTCQSHREGLQAMNLPSNCGFVVEPWSLPGAWGGHEVWLSFDQGGEFRLPQNEALTLPRSDGALGIASTTPLPPTVVVQSYLPMVEAAPAELRQHWQALEAFRHYLDGIEQQLAQQEQARALGESSSGKRTSLKRRWWSRVRRG